MDSAQKIIEELDQIRSKLSFVCNLLLPVKEQSIRLTDAWQQAKSCHDEVRAIVNRNNDEEQSIEEIIVEVLESIEEANELERRVFIKTVSEGCRKLSDAVGRDSRSNVATIRKRQEES